MSLYLFGVLLALVPCFSCQDGSEPDGEPKPDPQDALTYVYRRGEGGYDLFRIPALVRSGDGTLLLFAEARKESSNGDSGDIDLVVKRSSDNGKTWGPLIMIWDDGGNTCGNPVPIVTSDGGVIHLVMTWNNGNDKWSDIHNGTSTDTRRVFVTRSGDDGLLWDAPEEITAAVKMSSWLWFGSGPVHGIEVKNGPYAGRLIAPSYYTYMEGGQRMDYSYVVYSDDDGVTWKAGNSTPQSGVGECTVTEISGGRLLLNMRSGDGIYRKLSISEDGGESWSELTSDPALLDPRCQGSMVSYPAEQHWHVLQANPASTERNNMTIKSSTDDGQTWSGKYIVYSGASAYSDIVLLPDDLVGITFEMGGNSPYGNIVFKTIPLEKLF